MVLPRDRTVGYYLHDWSRDDQHMEGSLVVRTGLSHEDNDVLNSLSKQIIMMEKYIKICLYSENASSWGK